MNAIQRFVFNLFVLCCGFGIILFSKVDSYASTVSLKFLQRQNFSQATGVDVSFSVPSDIRVCVYAGTPVTSSYHNEDGTYVQNLYVFTNSTSPFFVSNNSFVNLRSDSGSFNYFYGSDRLSESRNFNISYNDTYQLRYLNLGYYTNCFTCYVNDSMYPLSVVGCPVFSSISDAQNYINDGVLPSLPFDETLNLESFKVTSWSIGNLQALFKSKFDVTWSDPRISVVQVRISGSATESTLEGSTSPFKGKFQASQYVLQKGDVIHLVATPYKADGSYGTSLYYSVTYSDDIPFSNTYRKLVNTNNNDNTLTIPYSGTSGNDTVTLPVDGVTTNVTYKVNYNPVTNEYGDTNIYEIYYSPVVVYPDNTSDQEVDDTQDTIINNYNTTNYYETTKNINIDFDVSFGDISGSDIQRTYDDIGNFSNGFGSLLGKLSSWILALFPFLSPVVASTIVVCGGLIITLAIIAFVLKIAGVIADLIPF